MADDDDTIPVEQTPENAPTASGGDEPASTADAPSGVRIPSWLAGALVVVLALLVAAAGFAIGRATAPDGAELRGPALIGRLPGADGRGPGGFPGGPGGQGGPGGSGGRERGPRFESGGSPDEQAPQPPGSGGTGNGDTGNGGTGN